MSLIEQIKQDQIQARKDRNKSAATTLTTLLGEASIVGKNGGDRETTDDEVRAVVLKFIKGNKELMDLTDPTSSTYTEAQNENELLLAYLPEQISNDRIEHIIADIIGSFKLTSARDMGIVMKALKAEYAGLYDGAFAGKSAKSQLAICEQVEKDKESR